VPGFDVLVKKGSTYPPYNIEIDEEPIVSRPLRIEYAGALYHITARGNERKAVYRADADRVRFLEILSTVCARLAWQCHAYCLMDNHYHLLLETPMPNLSKGMRILNGEYSRWFNQTHTRVGHLFQGRFKAILVEKEAYLLELARYIVLNPVRAEMVHQPEEWPWSSYRSTAGYTASHACLTTDWLRARFSSSMKDACLRYRNFIAEGKNLPNPMEQLKNQVYLGSAHFVEDALRNLEPERKVLEVSKVQLLSAKQPLDYFSQCFADRDRAIVMAYLSGHYTLEQVGAHFGKGRSTISRKVKAYEACGKWET
jgi:putative transposase